MLLTALLTVALAGDEPDNRLYYESLTAFRINPIGLASAYTLYYRRKLSDSDSVLLNGTHFSVGPTLTVNPAYSKGGIALQTLPIALVRLGAKWEAISYYGILDQILTTDDAGYDWSDTAREAAGERGENSPGGGWTATLDGRVQAKAGPIAARYTATAYLAQLQVRDPQPGAEYYYDQTLDVLSPLKGWTLTHDTDVLYAGHDRFVVGARWTHAMPLDSRLTRTHRAGPLFAYRFNPDSAGKGFAEPTLLVISQWHLKHPYRTGQDVTQALPYFVVAFSFNGDLIPW